MFINQHNINYNVLKNINKLFSLIGVTFTRNIVLHSVCLTIHINMWLQINIKISNNNVFQITNSCKIYYIKIKIGWLKKIQK